jgi:hypothetical protein
MAHVMWQEESFRLKSLFEHAICNSSKLLLKKQGQCQLEFVFRLTSGMSSYMPICKPSRLDMSTDLLRPLDPDLRS